jgi:hypothetical protein
MPLFLQIIMTLLQSLLGQGLGSSSPYAGIASSGGASRAGTAGSSAGTAGSTIGSPFQVSNANAGTAGSSQVQPPLALAGTAGSSGGGY